MNENQTDKSQKTTIRIRDTGVSVTDVLRLISEGYAYDQILRAYPKLNMGDIMAAADLARQVVEAMTDEHDEIEIHHSISFVFSKGKIIALEKLREEFPRAYLDWSDREDQALADMFHKGAKINDIAKRHQRQPGAIHVRLVRLGLMKQGSK
ncbi:MAG: DUF433 domain-containing protein [candidate division Zixibacteria bacterium]|nr:DUF433 domain-containing protein [candidate division Zixibacteria bacterium]